MWGYPFFCQPFFCLSFFLTCGIRSDMANNGARHIISCPDTVSAYQRRASMIGTSRELFLIAVLLALTAAMFQAFAWQKPEQTQKKFEPIETTIAEIHQAIRSGRITCRQLVEAYLKRINAYDQP